MVSCVTFVHHRELPNTVDVVRLYDNLSIERLERLSAHLCDDVL